MTDLTPALRRRLDAIFAPEDRETAAALLVSECGDALPFAETLGPRGIERIRAAVLKLSGGDLEALLSAVVEAQIDWRDVLVPAGFGDDPEAHHAWLEGTDA